MHIAYQGDTNLCNGQKCRGGEFCKSNCCLGYDPKPDEKYGICYDPAISNCERFENGADCTNGRECISDYCVHGVCRTESEYITLYVIVIAICFIIVGVTGFFCIRYVRNKFKGEKGAIYASQLYSERASQPIVDQSERQRLVQP